MKPYFCPNCHVKVHMPKIMSLIKLERTVKLKCWNCPAEIIIQPKNEETIIPNK